MDLKTAVCKTVNKLFPVPRHPFNLQSSGQETYAEWQYKRGEDTIRFFLDNTSTEEISGTKWYWISGAERQARPFTMHLKGSGRYTASMWWNGTKKKPMPWRDKGHGALVSICTGRCG